MIPELTAPLLAQVIGSTFVVGSLLLLFLTFFPATKSAAGKLWPLLGSEAVILTAGVLPFLLPHLALFAILLLAAARIGFESGSVHGITTGRNLSLSCAVLLPLTVAISWLAPGSYVLYGTGLIFVASAILFWASPDKSIAGNLARFIIFPLLPIAAFSHAASIDGLTPLLVLAFFLVEVFDSFSLLGGKLYGRTPLVPRLSPRKTWEGLATGTGATLLAILALTAWLGLPLAQMLASGAIVVSAAIAGDLMGSLAKRRAAVKDYPPIMKVQGGLLDIVDAWLLAGPCLAGISVFAGWG